MYYMFLQVFEKKMNITQTKGNCKDKACRVCEVNQIFSRYIYFL